MIAVLLLAAASPCAYAATQLELNLCTQVEFEAADKKLNAIWQQAKRRAQHNGSYANLLAAQRAWLKRRDMRCKAVAKQYEGGSMRPMQFSICMTQETEARVKVLRRQAK